MDLRIALVGCGRWGRNILRDLVSLDCSVSVYDPDPGVQAGLSTELAQNCQFVPELNQLNEDFDGFVVASPTDTHYQNLMVLIPYGRPIFCEKPMCADTEQAAEIARLAPDQVFVMEKWRYHEGIRALAEIAASGELGPVQQLRTIRVQLGQFHRDVDGCWILTPHDLSIVDQILGSVPPLVTVRGDWTGKNLDGVLAVFGNKPTAIIETSSRRPYPSRQVILSCEGGLAALESPLAEHINIIRFNNSATIAGEQTEQRKIPASMPLHEELKQFCEFLQGGPKPLVNAIKGAEMVRQIAQLRTTISNP